MELQTGIFSDVLADERVRLMELYAERRSSLENPQTPLSYPAEWLLDMFNGGRTDAGVRVSELTAFEVVTFLAGVDFIAGTIAALDTEVMERTISKINGRALDRKAYEHDYYDMVSVEPNEEMSATVMWKAFMCHCLAWGAGYIEMARNEATDVSGLWPRNPAKTYPRRAAADIVLKPEVWRPYPRTIKAGELAFETTDMVDFDESNPGARGSERRWIPKEDMIYVPGLTFDGRISQKTVYLARQTLGLALATDKYGSKYFANFARPGGILEVPAVKKEDRDKARETWMEAQGGENSHRVAVMPVGTKWTNTSNNPQEAQALETKSFIRTQVAALLHLPVRIVGDTSRSSRASVEQENIEILDFTLRPWLKLITSEVKRKMFPRKNPRLKSYYMDFNTWDLVRGDAASREKFYGTGRQWTFLSANDVRAFEKLNPIEEDWAEQYHVPANMTLAQTPLNPNIQDGAGKGKPGDEPKKENQNAPTPAEN